MENCLCQVQNTCTNFHFINPKYPIGQRENKESGDMYIKAKFLPYEVVCVSTMGQSDSNFTKMWSRSIFILKIKFKGYSLTHRQTQRFEQIVTNKISL